MNKLFSGVVVLASLCFMGLSAFEGSAIRWVINESKWPVSFKKGVNGTVVTIPAAGGSSSAGLITQGAYNRNTDIEIDTQKNPKSTNCTQMWLVGGPTDKQYLFYDKDWTIVDMNGNAAKYCKASGCGKCKKSDSSCCKEVKLKINEDGSIQWGNYCTKDQMNNPDW